MSTQGPIRHRSFKSRPEHLLASGMSTKRLVTTTGRWIEKCTGCLQGSKTFVEYLEDGTLLCILIQHLVPGMIKKVNRIKSPFAWRENIIFFLSACSKLGLSEGQLFSPEDLIATATSSCTANLYKAKGSQPGSEYSLRQVSLTLYHLALLLECRSDFAGPPIQQEIRPLKQFSDEALPDHKVGVPHPEELGHLSSSDFTPLTTTSSSSSTVQSPSGSRTRRVESISHLTTETRCTDIQSYAELVLYMNGSNKKYTTVDTFAPIRLRQSFNQPGNCKSRVHRTFSDRTPRVSKSLYLSSVPDDTCASGLLENFGSSCSQEEVRRGSWQTPKDYREHDSPPTPSDTPFVIHRAVASSLCNKPVATSKDCSASCRKEQNLETSTERLPHPYPNVPGSINNDKDCSVLAQEVEFLRISIPISAEPFRHLTRLERDLANIALQDISRREVTVQSEHRDSETRREEISGTTQQEVTATGKVGGLVTKLKSCTIDLDSTEAPVSVDSSPTFDTVRTHDIKSPWSASLKDIAVIGRSNCRQSPFDAEQSYYNCYSEQVTDVHEEKKKTPELIFCSTGGSFQRTVAAKRAMDTHTLTQHGSNHVSDSEPVSLSGIKMRGYPSNCQSKEMGLISNSSMVPHHSLSLAISDPESPSSCKMLENSTGESRGLPTNFDLVPHINTKLNHVLPVHMGSLDISRVKSDALPQSSLPRMTTITDGGESRIAPSRFMADAHNIDISSFEGMDSVSIDDNEMSVSPRALEPAIMEAPEDDGKWMEASGIVEQKEGQQWRNSSPRKFSSSSLTPTSIATSTTSPSHSVKTAHSVKNVKRKSLDLVRQRRIVNIHESTRTALQYSANWKSSKPDPLSRDARGPSMACSSASTGSEDGEDNVASTASLLAYSTATTSDVPTPSSSQAGGATNKPLNLRHLSMDQTKQASVTQMYEIWKEVEAIGSQSEEKQDSVNSQPIGLSSSRTASPAVGEELVDMGIAEQRNLDVCSAARSRSRSLSSNWEESEKPIPGVISEGDDDATTNHRTPKMHAMATDNTSKKKRNMSNSFSSQEIESLLDTLKSLSRQDEDDDLRMLEDMLKSNTFKQAKRVHDSMHSLLTGSVAPAAIRVVPSTQMMREHLHHHTEPSPEVDELRALLRSPDIQALLFCHDKVSTHDLYVPIAKFHPTTHDPVDIILSPSVDNFHTLSASSGSHHAASSRDVPSNRKEGASIVYLERTNRPLGCTIYKQDDAVFIGKLLRGCDAGSSDMLCEGDELLEVNGVPVAGMRTDDIIYLMSGDVASGSTLAFTIIPIHDESYDVDFESKYLRVHFNYDGSHDAEVPCKALALFFQKGDIMEVVQQDDPNWWQACKVFEEGSVSLPGLMPSMHLQQMREAMVYSHPHCSAVDSKKGLRSLFFKKKKKTIYYQNTPPRNTLGIGDEIPTYEEVVMMDPDPSLCRPIVLVGAPGVGRKTLMRKLIEFDPSLYQTVIQHTSRGPRAGEVNGHNFYFVSREEFEIDIDQDRFLEYGESKGHLSGIAFSSIKRVMESGRVPVMDVHPQSLKKIRHTGLKPFVVFVASPKLERLQVTRRLGSQKQKKRLSVKHHLHLADMAHIFTESDLHHLVKESQLIETQYGHYFDWVMVNDDFQVAADMLKEVSRRLEHERQWVPAAWKNY